MTNLEERFDDCKKYIHVTEDEYYDSLNEHIRRLIEEEETRQQYFMDYYKKLDNENVSLMTELDDLKEKFNFLKSISSEEELEKHKSSFDNNGTFSVKGS